MTPLEVPPARARSVLAAHVGRRVPPSLLRRQEVGPATRASGRGEIGTADWAARLRTSSLARLTLEPTRRFRSSPSQSFWSGRIHCGPDLNRWRESGRGQFPMDARDLRSRYRTRALPSPGNAAIPTYCYRRGSLYRANDSVAARSPPVTQRSRNDRCRDPQKPAQL